MMPDHLPPRVDVERGSTIPLLVFCCLLSLMLAWVTTAATSLYIERKQLLALADAAALAATESFTIADLSQPAPDALRVQLRDEHLRAAALSAVHAAGARFEGLELRSASSPDGQTALVTVSAVWRPPIISDLFPAQLTIEATATARTLFAQ